MRILVVDDEAAMRQIVTRILAQTGHEIVEAENGLAAWESFRRRHFPLVVTDLVMPEMDGLDLIRNIRSAGYEAYTYILVLTVVTEPKYVVMSQDAGADDYLSKPIDPLEVLARVKIGERFLKMNEAMREALRRAEADADESGA